MNEHDEEDDRAKAWLRSLPRPWTQKDTDILHEMVRDYNVLKEIVRDYENARWFRRQAKWWAMWGLGIPAAMLSFWEPIVKLWHIIRGH